MATGLNQKELTGIARSATRTRNAIATSPSRTNSPYLRGHPAAGGTEVGSLYTRLHKAKIRERIGKASRTKPTSRGLAAAATRMKSAAARRNRNKVNSNVRAFLFSHFESCSGANGAQSKKAAAAARMKTTITSPACNRGEIIVQAAPQSSPILGEM